MADTFITLNSFTIKINGSELFKHTVNNELVTLDDEKINIFIQNITGISIHSDKYKYVTNRNIHIIQHNRNTMYLYEMDTSRFILYIYSIDEEYIKLALNIISTELQKI